MSAEERKAGNDASASGRRLPGNEVGRLRVWFGTDAGAYRRRQSQRRPQAGNTAATEGRTGE